MYILQKNVEKTVYRIKRKIYEKMYKKTTIRKNEQQKNIHNKKYIHYKLHPLKIKCMLITTIFIHENYFAIVITIILTTMMTT